MEVEGRPALGELSGEVELDDALLEACHGDPGAFEGILCERDVGESRLAVFEQAYVRWCARACDDATETVRATSGVLGFCLMTMLMVRWTRREIGSGAEESPEAWRPMQEKLDRLFADPNVRKCFSALYAPPADLDLDAATVHRLGTTSFILHCVKNDNTRDQIALKCLLYPYTRNRQIAEATRAYERLYAPTEMAAKAHMPRVYRSSDTWIEMDFIEGRTLAERLRERPVDSEPEAVRVRLERVRRYGLPLLAALAVLPVAHLDLSPSNIIVQERESEDGTATVTHICLVDFGENYLLTQDVGSGRLVGSDARFVAPELLSSRGRREYSGNEDLFSVGQLLLAIAGFARADGGFVPTALYEDAPFLAPIVEDLVDRAPDQRLLLMDDDHFPTGAGEERRHGLYRALRRKLRDGLTAQETLAPMSPTLASARTPAGILDRLLRQLGSLPQMVGAVRRPLEFAAAAGLLGTRRMEAADETEFRYLFWWVFICSCGWLAIWLATTGGLAYDALHTSLLPDPQEVLRATWPLLDLQALAAHYRALFGGPPVDWQSLLARLALLSFGVTAARYYLDIFATLTTRRLHLTPGGRRVEVVMRLTALGYGPALVAANVWFLRDWMLFSAAAALWIVTNNYLSCQLATRLASRGERAFSTVRNSDLHQILENYSEWWKLMLVYVAALMGTGLLVKFDLARDVWVYALAVITLNMVKLYRSNCGKLAPAIRASLLRAFVTGQRLEAMSRR